MLESSKKLYKVLAQNVNIGSIKRILSEADISLSSIEHSKIPLNYWFNIVEFAELNSKIPELIASVQLDLKEKSGFYQELDALLGDYQREKIQVRTTGPSFYLDMYKECDREEAMDTLKNKWGFRDQVNLAIIYGGPEDHPLWLVDRFLHQKFRDENLKIFPPITFTDTSLEGNQILLKLDYNDQAILEAVKSFFLSSSRQEQSRTYQNSPSSISLDYLLNGQKMVQIEDIVLALCHIPIDPHYLPHLKTKLLQLMRSFMNHFVGEKEESYPNKRIFIFFCITLPQSHNFIGRLLRRKTLKKLQELQGILDELQQVCLSTYHHFQSIELKIIPKPEVKRFLEGKGLLKNAGSDFVNRWNEVEDQITMEQVRILYNDLPE